MTEEELRRQLRRHFGYSEFRGTQAAVIKNVCSGRSQLLVMPTGAGKSLCYQLPAILRNGVGLIISPLLALMHDQVQALTARGVRAAYLAGNYTRRQKDVVFKSLHAQRLDLLYVSPERFVSEGFQQEIQGLSVSTIAVDEAHCVSQWGYDFRPDYLRLPQLLKRWAAVPLVAVTATADPISLREIAREFGLQKSEVLIHGFDRPNICYRVVEKRDAQQQLLEFLQEREGRAGIVYCRKRKTVEDYTEFLQRKGFLVEAYHAGRKASERRRVQDAYVRGDLQIVVATVAFGMGVDRSDVRFVCHLGLPQSIESYYQETGRAGRDGEAAEAWLCYSPADAVLLRKTIFGQRTSLKRKQIELRRLNALIGFCETTCCRRDVLLRYFGEAGGGDCGNCDNCLFPQSNWDGTDAAQRALSCVYRTGQRYAAGHLIDVLLGKRSRKVLRAGHDRLSTFAIGQHIPAQQWHSIFRQLQAAGFVSVDVEGYGSLRITKRARSVLSGESTVSFRLLGNAKSESPPR